VISWFQSLGFQIQLIPLHTGWRAYSVPQRLLLGFVAAYVAVHVAVPTRHFFLYQGNPSWSEEGHLAAWHMMLRSKHGGAVQAQVECSLDPERLKLPGLVTQPLNLSCDTLVYNFAAPNGSHLYRYGPGTCCCA
jgi:hypothetical protein